MSSRDSESSYPQHRQRLPQFAGRRERCYDGCILSMISMAVTLEVTESEVTYRRRRSASHHHSRRCWPRALHSVMPASSSSAVETDGDITYLAYNSEHYLQGIIDLISLDLSEPYSIFTYRYFMNQWPQLCFVAHTAKGNPMKLSAQGPVNTSLL